MWKYESKRNLLIILVAMVVGAIFVGVSGYGKESIALDADMLKQMGVSVKEVQAIISQPYFFYMCGALYFGGIANSIILAFSIFKKYQLNSYVTMMILLFACTFLTDILTLIGMLLLIPCIIVYIYGMLTIKNKAERKALKQAQKDGMREFKQIFFNNHQRLDDYYQLGKKLATKVWLSYGAIALALIILAAFFIIINNPWYWFIAIILYLGIYYSCLKLKSKLLGSILNLLFIECYPEACINAIIGYNDGMHSKNKLLLGSVAALSCIHLNDPSMAIDALVLGQCSKERVKIDYYMIMAQAYYQMGDLNMVKQQYDLYEQENDNISLRQIIDAKSFALLGIKALIDLMSQQFSQARKYYEKMFKEARSQISKLENSYYLGMIYFIDQEYDNANKCFSIVKELGIHTFMYEKACHFLEQLALIKKREEIEE